MSTAVQPRPDAATNLDTRLLFAERGVRCTRQRVDIFASLADAKSHPTAEELHRLVNARAASAGQCCDSDDPGISGSEGGCCVSLATVYNTLEALCRVGLVRRLPSAAVTSNACSGSGARYEADLREHVHLTTADGAVHDVPDDLGQRILARIGPDLLRDVERRMGVRIGRVTLELFGEDADRSV